MKTLIVKKPWGQFDQFTYNELSTVKVISINSDSELSLQYHKNRSEFWRILSGHPIVTIGEKEQENKVIAIKKRDEKEIVQLKIEDFISQIKKEIEKKV